MKSLVRVGAVLVLVAVLAVGGVWFYRQRAAAQSTAAAAGASGSFTQVVEAQRGNLSSSLTVVGGLDAVQRESLSFEKMKGTTPLLTLAVAAGNTVKQGQVLATIGAASYQQALDQAKSDLQSAEQTLADLQAPADSQDIAVADVKIAKAAEDVEQAKQDLADLKSTDLTDLQDAVKNARDALALAQLQQTLAQSDSSAKSERDLQYSIAWHERRINELQALVATGKANKEQTDQVATEQDDLSQAQADLARVQSERQLSLSASAAEITNAKAALAQAQQALADAQKGGDALARAKAELAIKEAEVNLAAAKDARAQLSAGADATELAAAQADVDKKKLAVADAEAALAGTQLVAPFDGTVLETAADAGTTIGATTPILTLADLGQLEVLASVDETTIRRVSQGQAAEVTFDALAGQTLAGMVGEVPLQGTLQGGVMVYEVPITLTGAEQLPLLVGMTANVKIATGQAQNALLVPAMALQKVNGLYQVTVQTGAGETATTETVPVEVGLSDGTYTQIVRGLNEGDKIVVTIANTQNTNPFAGFGGLGGFGGPPPGERQRTTTGSSQPSR